MLYLDYNATAPLRPEVLVAMEQCVEQAGNPASLHAAGRATRRRLDAARDAVLELVGGGAAEVVLTASGTEADNLAVLGLARERRRSVGANAVLLSAIEHPAVVASAERLAGEGFELRYAPVGADGRVDLNAVAALLDPSVATVAVMLANNETGVLQPVADVCELAAAHRVPVHVDAVQAVGKVAIDFDAMGAATLALSAHKFGGPRGIGALLVRDGVVVPPAWRGGSQEGGVRPGTQASLLAVGLGAAAQAAKAELVGSTGVARLRDRLESGLLEEEGAQLSCSGAPRLPNTLSIGFRGVPSHLLVDRLSAAGVMVSGGAACHADRVEASAVLLAMGLPADRAVEVVRLSTGHATTEAEIGEALRIIRSTVHATRMAA